MTGLWRICRRPFADLTGEGARLFGGRWNTPGKAVIYTAETAALAVLEVRVHLDLGWDILPDDYVLVSIDTGTLVPEDLDTLPQAPSTFGDEWLRSERSALLRVPSYIVPESANVLINPAYPDASRVAIRSMRVFSFDKRLWSAT